MEPIAIVGLSFKLPQEAKDEAGLWSILESGKNVMTEWPKARANIDAFYDADASKDNRVCFSAFDTLHPHLTHFSYMPVVRIS